MSYLSTAVQISAGLALGLAVINSQAAEAASITYSFSGTLNVGDLAGQSFTGSLSYRDDTLDSATDFLPLETFLFEFAGTAYGLSDLQEPDAAAFFEGVFLGLDTFITDGSTAFFFTPALFDARDGDAFLTVTANGQDSNGFVNYQRDAAAVPAPSMVTGILGLGVATFRRRRQAAEVA